MGGCFFLCSMVSRPLAGKTRTAGGDSMAGAGTSEGFIHILVPERTHALGSAGFPHVPSVCGLTLPQPYTWASRGSIPGRNTWTAGVPAEPAEAKRPLQPSLGSPMASFLAYSIGEGSHKAIRLKGRETTIQDALFRSSQQGLHSALVSTRSPRGEASVLLSAGPAPIPPSTVMILVGGLVE